MIQTNETAGTQFPAREAYEAPTCEIIEMQQEGVLCGSYDGNHDGFGEDDWSGLFK